MATIESWDITMADTGALYPFVGSEWFWLIVCVVFWIVWHVMQTKMETSTYEEELKRFGDADSLKRLVGHEDPENP